MIILMMLLMMKTWCGKCFGGVVLRGSIINQLNSLKSTQGHVHERAADVSSPSNRHHQRSGGPCRPKHIITVIRNHPTTPPRDQARGYPRQHVALLPDLTLRSAARLPARATCAVGVPFQRTGDLYCRRTNSSPAALIRPCAPPPSRR